MNQPVETAKKYATYEYLAVALFACAGFFAALSMFKQAQLNQRAAHAEGVVDVAIEMACSLSRGLRTPQDLGERVFTAEMNRGLGSADVGRLLEMPSTAGAFVYKQVAMVPAPMFKTQFIVEGAEKSNGQSMPEYLGAIKHSSNTRVVMNTFELVPGHETCGDAMIRLQRKLEMSNF